MGWRLQARLLFKKQTIVTSKVCSTLVAVNALVATFKTSLEK